MAINLEKINHKTVKIIRLAGEIIKMDFLRTIKIKQKSNKSNFATRTDLAVERFLVKEFTKLTPNFSIYAEEENLNPRVSQYRWIIDPIDGTHNFYLGIPNCSISVALIKDHQAILAYVYNPLSGQFYHARSGQGAYLADKKISVSQNSQLESANVCFSQNYGTIRGNKVEKYMFNQLVRTGERLMINWSVALDCCLLAQGSVDVFVDVECEIYDRAAGFLIAKEAGAKITDFEGQTANYDTPCLLLTNNSALHDYFLSELKKIS